MRKKRQIISIDDDLWARFKVSCAKKRITMNLQITVMIKEFNEIYDEGEEEGRPYMGLNNIGD